MSGSGRNEEENCLDGEVYIPEWGCCLEYLACNSECCASYEICTDAGCIPKIPE